MDDLSRKFRSLDWKSLQKSARRVQQSTASALKDLVMTDLENKTRSSTADTPWGASTTDLQTIAQGTYNRDDYALIMSIVWQRLASTRWRCVYKALEVLKFLVMHGSSRCLEEARGALGHLETLRAYRRVEGGRDVGEGVRTRAEGLVEMLRDDEVLGRERERSEELRRKMVGGGEGVYGAGGGRYDPGGGYAEEDGTVNRVGTSGYKGYGDGGGAGVFKGYDDDATGLKGYGEPGEGAKTQGVDDLLGGAGDGTEDGNEEDDEFDPRNTTPDDGGSHTQGEADLFAALSTRGDSHAEGARNDPRSAGAETTSALVARLAAEKGVVVVHSSTASAPGAVSPGGDLGGGIWDDHAVTNGSEDTDVANGIWTDTPPPPQHPHTNAHPRPQPPSQNHPRVTKKDDDPFSAVLLTAKKTYT